MKTGVLSLLFLGAALLAGAQERKVVLDESNPLTLAENGKSCCRIEAADYPVAKFAAAELEKYLTLATGAGPSQDGTVILKVGLLPPGVDEAALPRDGFVIKSEGNVIYLAGRDDRACAPNSKRAPWGDLFERATLFAVYDFLERFAGARFVFPGEAGEYVRKSPTLKVPAMDIFERPDNTVRFWTWENDPRVKLNNYRLRSQTTLIPNNHGLRRLGFADRFGKSHPEYFAMRANGTRSVNPQEHCGGHLCYSSPVREEIYQDAKAYLTGVSAKDRGVWVDRFKGYVWDPNAAYGRKYINIMPPDGMTGCLCPACKALAEKDPNWLSNQIWGLTAEIANRLKAEGIGGYVTQMAYGIPRNIPSCDIPENVVVQLAVDGPWSIRKPDFWERQNRLLTDWTKKLGHKVYLWTYPCKYSSRNILNVPCSTPRAVAAFQSLVRDRIFGGFQECGADHPAYQVFNKYVFAKMMWNKDTDGEKLYEDTCCDLFGQGADAMLKFFDRLEDLWLDKICCNVVMTPTGPEGCAPNERTLWEKIYSPEVRAELRSYIAEARKAAEGDADSLKRIGFFEREYLDRLENAAIQFEAVQKARELCSAIVTNSRETAKELILRDPGDTPTSVRVWKDEENLYIHADCAEPAMEKVHTQQLPKDDSSIWAMNCMEIFLDPGAEGKEYFQFMISSDGQMCDLKVDAVTRHADVSWNSGASLITETAENGWAFTLRIPLVSLGTIPNGRIGADFSRARVLTGEKPRYTRWSPFAKFNGDAENFGLLFLKPPPKSNLLKIDRPGDAEKNPESILPWFFSKENGAFVKADRGDFLFDGHSILLENPDKRDLHVQRTITGLQGGKRYRIRFFVKTNLKSGSAFMQLNTGANISFPNDGIRGVTPWTAYAYEFTAPEGIESRQSYIRLYVYKAEGSARFDGASLEEIRP